MNLCSLPDEPMFIFNFFYDKFRNTDSNLDIRPPNGSSFASVWQGVAILMP